MKKNIIFNKISPIKKKKEGKSPSKFLENEIDNLDNIIEKILAKHRNNENEKNQNIISYKHLLIFSFFNLFRYIGNIVYAFSNKNSMSVNIIKIILIIKIIKMIIMVKRMKKE